MRPLKLLLLLLLCFPVSQFVKGQIVDPDGKRIWQLSGLVLSKSGGDSIPYARIGVNRSRRYAECNHEGFYSLPVYEDDTLYFYALGYKRSYFIVRNYLRTYKGDLKSGFIYAIHYLDEDSITLPTVTIFPYRTPGELRAAILNTDIPSRIEELYARNNLDPRVLDIMIENMDIDKGERIGVGRQLYYNTYLRQNVTPTANFFDPIAIYQLLKQVGNKIKKKKTRNLNYWLD